MEITDSFLVAMMFVMILSIGIASVLAGLGNIVKDRVEDFYWLPIAWVGLVLFSHLDLFWHTVLIVAVEEWRFTGFLYMIGGPVLLFLAATVLVSESAKGESMTSLSHYMEISPYFFTLLALLMLWTLGADYVLGQERSISNTQHAIELVIFVVLAVSKNIKLHQAATILTCAVVLLVVLARGLDWSNT